MDARDVRLEWALAGLVATSAVDLRTLGLPLGVRAGFVFAGVGVAALAAVVARKRATVFGVLAPHRALGLALAGVLASRAASALGNGLSLGAMAEVARAAVVATALLLALTLGDDDVNGGLRHRLGVAGAAVLSLNAALFAAGIVFPAARARVFELAGGHELLGALPRFRGGSASAGVCGFQLLLATLLVRGIEKPRWRRAAGVGGVLLVASTLSFATLCLPLAASIGLVRGRALRWGTAALALSAALGALWIHPLELRIGGLTLLDRPPSAAWQRDGLGPRFMPVHRVALGETAISFHATAYLELLGRSGTCMGEHPLVGVGGRGFERDCPVMAMNTLEQWTDRRGPHSEYGGQLAEYGLLGVVATLCLVLVLVTRYRLRANDPCAQGLLAAYLASGFAGSVWYQIPLAAFVGAWTSATLAPSRAAAARQPPSGPQGQDAAAH